MVKSAVGVFSSFSDLATNEIIFQFYRLESANANKKWIASEILVVALF
jgi:hypothetical protein